MIFEKCCDMRLSLSPTNDLSFDNGETPPRQKGTRSAPLVSLFYFPLTQLVYRDVEQQMVLTKFFIFGW